MGSKSGQLYINQITECPVGVNKIFGYHHMPNTRLGVDIVYLLMCSLFIVSLFDNTPTFSSSCFHCHSWTLTCFVSLS